MNLIIFYMILIGHVGSHMTANVGISMTRNARIEMSTNVQPMTPNVRPIFLNVPFSQTT